MMPRSTALVRLLGPRNIPFPANQQFCFLVMETAAAILAHVAQRIEHSYVPGRETNRFESGRGLVGGTSKNGSIRRLTGKSRISLRILDLNTLLLMVFYDQYRKRMEKR